MTDCALGEALVGLARQLPPELLLSAVERLQAAGVPILDSGSLPDADALWLTLRFPGSQYPELWLLEGCSKG